MRILLLLLLFTNSYGVCRDTYRELVPQVEAMGFTVTSTNKGRHNKGSKHYLGRAIDIRTRDQSEWKIDLLIDIMRNRGYIVIDERKRPVGQRVWSGPHIHIHSPWCH